jgi:hypothetical protein
MYTLELQRTRDAVVEHDFAMTLDRTDSADIGALLINDGVALVVKEIFAGLLQAWNQAHPDLQVYANDSIVEVNGVCGDAHTMLDELSRDQILELKIMHAKVDLRTKMTEHVQTMAQLTTAVSEDFWRKTKKGLKKVARQPPKEEGGRPEDNIAGRAGELAAGRPCGPPVASNCSDPAIFAIDSDDEADDDFWLSSERGAPKFVGSDRGCDC